MLAVGRVTVFTLTGPGPFEGSPCCRVHGGLSKLYHIRVLTRHVYRRAVCENLRSVWDYAAVLDVSLLLCSGDVASLEPRRPIRSF